MIIFFLLVPVYVTGLVSWWRTKVASWKVTWTRTAEAYKPNSHRDKKIRKVLPGWGVRIMYYNYNNLFRREVQKEMILDRYITLINIVIW